jgi:hypothetical protein
MALRAWRRFHAGGIVAAVDPVVDLWQPSVWLASDPRPSVRESHRLPFLQSAQAAADDLARSAFDHQCEPQMCGEWTPWPLEPLQSR